MGSTSLPKSCSRRNLHRAIAHQRDVLFDCERSVDVARDTLDRDVTMLHSAVIERDRASTHLRVLVEWEAELAAVPGVVRPAVGTAAMASGASA
jgi:hypothetical protein